MSDTLKLGQVIDGEAQRDAVHVAVAPVVAAHILTPGEHVGFVDADQQQVGRVVNRLGIVDPYLKDAVMPGQRFWLFLYPQTITSLRHDWTHPAFEAELKQPEPTKAISEAWLRRFCESADCPGYESVMAALVADLPSPDPTYYDSGSRITHEYLHFNGRDAHGEIPLEFWEHAEIVLGRKFSKRPGGFSCSC